jgi:polyphenol oxidase
MRLSRATKREQTTADQAVGDQLRAAGLVQGRHRSTSVRTEPLQFEHVVPDELRLPQPVPRRAANGVGWLPVPKWNLPWLLAGFSTRLGGLSRAYCAEDLPGELNLGFTEADDREAVRANRRLLAEAVSGSPETPLVPLRQFHSNLVVKTSAADATRTAPRKADGQMTDEPGFLLAVQTADCIPVLVADRRRRAVAAFHAGWRGTVKRIVESGVGRMRLAFASRPEDLVAAIGPGCSRCCYAVGDEVLSEFESQFAYAHELFLRVEDTDPVRRKYPMLFLTQRAPGHSPIGPALHLDLIEANRRQLLAAGIRPAAIQVVNGCTQCHAELFFSHRASHGHTGRMMAVIGVNETPKSRSRAT